MRAMIAGINGDPMIRLAGLLSSFCMLVLLWHECGENPAFFCYRIGHGFFKIARQRALVLVPVPIAARMPMRPRTNTACLTPFSTSSARYTAPKG